MTGTGSGVGTTTPSVPLLREVKLLQCFTDPELGQLIAMGNSVTYEAHSNIIIEGETSWGLYLILDGTVGIYKSNKLTGNTTTSASSVTATSSARCRSSTKTPARRPSAR